MTPRGIRPSQGVVKEAVYNVLAGKLEGAVVIDLCAGSGALGIEAASRGAREVTFVEADPRVAGVLKRNLAALDLLKGSRVHVGDACRWVELHPAEVAAAGLVLADPPYNDPMLAELLVRLDQLVTGTVVVEWSGRGELPSLERLVIRRDRAYGATRLTILTPR